MQGSKVVKDVALDPSAFCYTGQGMVYVKFGKISTRSVLYRTGYGLALQVSENFKKDAWWSRIDAYWSHMGAWWSRNPCALEHTPFCYYHKSYLEVLMEGMA